MKTNYRIVIPTRDSARWVGVFLSTYREMGIEPLYIVDARSVDDTLGVLRAMGAEIDQFTPTADYAEAGMIEYSARRAGTQWVFRIDDDEFPSPGFKSWIDRVSLDDKLQAIYISRLELFQSGDAVVCSRAPGRYGNIHNADLMNPLPRLFQPDRVRFIHQVHTPGYEEPAKFVFAPEDVFLIHCNCIVRSASERLKKLRIYEHARKLSAWRLADECLPELFSRDWHNPTTEGLEPFAHLLAALPRPDGDFPIDISDDERVLMNREVQKLAEFNRKNKIRNTQKAQGQPSLAHNSYDAPWGETVDFSRYGLPTYIDLVHGLSHPEDFGRWTDGANVEFRFCDPLPPVFELTFKGFPYGPNIGNNLIIEVGLFKKALRVKKASASTWSTIVDNQARSKTIILNIPVPTSPTELGISDDQRKLGLALSSLRVTPVTASARWRWHLPQLTKILRK